MGPYNNKKRRAAKRGQNAGESEVAMQNQPTPKPQAAAKVKDKSMKICNKDFRTDEGGTPGWNFKKMMDAGQSYLDLPVPRKLTPRTPHDFDMGAMLSEDERKDINKKRSEACKLLRYISSQYIPAMAHSDIGIGTDPKRSEQHILNKKKQILVRKIFATCLFYPGLSETVQTVHTITEESQLSNGKKIDFGIAGGFEGVQLGFEVANESSDWSHSRRIIAIADLRYQWATTESRIHRDKLYKFLTKDCKDALEKINDEGVHSIVLAFELSRFIEKYGTHVVLKCTHGYRMEKVESTSVSSAKELKKFKAGMMASVLDYAGFNVDNQKEALKTANRAENSLGIMNIGSKEHMKNALEGRMLFDFEEMIEKSGEEGDAGVISHDWNMMISEMLLAKNSPYKKTAAKRLQYWTHVRINDLKAGWDEGLFATSYELKFVHQDQNKKGINNNICVMIGGRTVVHRHPGNDTGSYSYGHITNVHTNEAKKVRISVLDDELALRDVLTKITVFKRFVADDGVEGRVCATTIDTSCVFESEVEVAISDLPQTYDFGLIDSRETDYEESEESLHGGFADNYWGSNLDSTKTNNDRESNLPDAACCCWFGSAAAKQKKKKLSPDKIIEIIRRRRRKPAKSKLQIDTSVETIGKARAKVC